jgi:hypothetical protein
MRQDQVEVPSSKMRRQRRSRGGATPREKFSHASLGSAPVQPLEVVDEAFAGFTRVDSGMARLDVHSQLEAIGAVSMREPVIDRDIIATLSAQLKALDKQREQLSRLLQTVDGLPA